MSFSPNIPVQIGRKKRRFRKGRFFSILVIALAIVAGGYLLHSVLTKVNDAISTSDSGRKAEQQATTTKNNPNGSTVNETTTKPQNTSNANVDKTPPKDYSALKTDLETYIKSFKGKYGISFLSLDDGAQFGINDTEQYIAASTIKVPINLYLFKRIEEGYVDPESTMTYQSGDKEGGTGSIRYERIGTKYTIRELSKRSIEQSDNVATNMLTRLLGKQNYKDYMKQMGGTVLADQNVSCPKDMTLYLKNLYDFNKSNSELGGELVNYFENTMFDDRLTAKLSKDVPVAHKTGNYWDDNWGSALHDVGIVFTDKPYIISVMTKNVNEAEVFDAIATISKKVYDFVNN